MPDGLALPDKLPRQVTLASESDFAGFRDAARALIGAGVEPRDVEWKVAGRAEASLFEDAQVSVPAPLVQAARPAKAGFKLPAEFLATCASAALHAEPNRFVLLYRLLWRVRHEPSTARDVLDDDVMRARAMAHAVRRDMHKMTAFVRFRLLQDGAGAIHLAWFEPGHHIVEAVAPFFMRRFANERWSILTPRGSVRWHRDQPGGLVFGPPASAADVPPADAGEQLWLTYYRHIFNPARLKLAMMAREMPRRYWHNLPEAALIGELAQQALSRTAEMIAAEPAPPQRAVRWMARPTPLAAEVLPGEIDSLESLREATQHCRRCPIGALATQAVCGEGPIAPALMLVGEQPGDQEDLRGHPFVGPAGQLLDRALRDLGIGRADVYLANAVKHFKFELRGKRRIHKTAAQKEALACSAWLEKEIGLVQPRALVALGATAARSLLGRPVAVGESRGRWLRRADGLAVCVTLHPSALLRAAGDGPGPLYAGWLADLRLALDPPSERD